MRKRQRKKNEKKQDAEEMNSVYVHYCYVITDSDIELMKKYPLMTRDDLKKRVEYDSLKDHSDWHIVPFF